MAGISRPGLPAAVSTANSINIPLHACTDFTFANAKEQNVNVVVT